MPKSARRSPRSNDARRGAWQTPRVTYNRLAAALAVPALLLALNGCDPVEDDASNKARPSAPETEPEGAKPEARQTTATEAPATSSTPTPTPTAKPKEPSKVSVPLVKRDPDTSYAVKPTALVTNEEYYDGDELGTVTVTAMSTREPCGVSVACEGDNRHFLTVVLRLKSGGSLKCQEFRSQIWSADQQYEDIPLQCEKKLTLSDVASVVMVAL